MNTESTTDTDTSTVEHRFDIAKSYLMTRTPGLLDMLNTYFIHNYGRDVFTLLLESPCMVYSIINNISGDEDIARFILVYVLLKPLMNILDQDTQQRLYSDIAKCMDINL